MRRFVTPLCLAVSALAFAGAAFAATLDSPDVQPVLSGRTSVKVQVVASQSGAPAGFRVQWMPASTFDAIGSWPVAGDASLMQADFTGTPTLNVTDGTSTFRLGSMATAGLQIGDLFDETGLSANLNAVQELAANTDYVVRVQAIGDAAASASTWSATTRVTTANAAIQNCTFTQGYWKNHPNSWPVTSLVIGTVTYTKAQILQVYGQPAAGNGLVSLFHQLSAAKLNVAQSAIPPAAVATAIANADALIGNLVAPPIGSGSLSPASTSALTQTLDDFNNGVTGPGHCGTVGAKSATWGVLKLRYR